MTAVEIIIWSLALGAIGAVALGRVVDLAAHPARSLPSDYPAFSQSFDGPLVVLATNHGSRRWSCNASWTEGYDDLGRLVTRTSTSHFYVHPHAVNEMVLRRAVPAAERYAILGEAEIDCSS